MAAASALTEPDSPEKSMVEATTLMPRPPVIQPTSIVTNRTSFSAAPERCRISPVSTNNGIARSVNEFSPWKTACAATVSGRPAEKLCARPTAPRAATIGAPTTIRTRMPTKAMAKVMPHLPVSPARAGRCRW